MPARKFLAKSTFIGEDIISINSRGRFTKKSSEGFNEKVESLCSRYEDLKTELEIFEQERGSILDDVHNRYYNTGDELKNKELMLIIRDI